MGLPSGNTGVHEFYLALLGFHRRTGLDPVDPIAFQAWLATETDLVDAIGGSGLVASYLDTFLALPLSTPESVATILQYRANKRKQLNSLQELQQLITKKEFKTPADNVRVSYLTDQIRALEQEIGYDPLSLVRTGKDIAEHADALWDLPDFLPTQFPELNKAMGYDPNKGGFCKGAVSAVLAQSGRGKSTFVKCLCNYWLDQGYRTLFINFEEAVAHWERILMTQVTGKNVYAGVNAADRVRYTKVFQDKMAEWGDRFMVRHDPETSYFDDLELWLRDIIGHNDPARNPDVVIIDTIQSMQMKMAGGKPRWGEYEQMMIRLERLAKDMNCVFIITAQENSNRLKERREVVNASDAGGSLTIVQKSTVTIFITEKRLASGDDSDDEYLMQLQIPKNRITGTVFMKDPPLIMYNDDKKTFEEFILSAGPDHVSYDYEEHSI